MAPFATISAMFVEGVLSFFSPCILPLIPLYIGYLTADAKSVDENGVISYKRSKVLLTTFFFVLGISTVFFIAGLSILTFKEFFDEYKIVFSMLCGMLLIVFGLVYLNIIKIPALNKEHRLPIKLDLNKMTYFKAFVLGFFFSFAWTPCIGPMLSSAVIMAANATSVWLGNAYLLAYALGFIFIFLMLGLFTEEILNLLKKNQNILKYTVTLGGLLILLMGGWMIWTSTSEIISLQSLNVKPEVSDSINQETVPDSRKDIEKYNFTLLDQNGVEHALLDYEGEPVFVTFFATWCGYCKKELPILQELKNENPDLNVLVIVRPDYGQEIDEAGIKKYIADNGFEDMTFLFDEGQVFTEYGVTSFPTSFVYKADGSMLGYVPGAVEKDKLLEILEQAR